MADHALATITNPSAALTDFSLIVDLSRMPASWWAAVTSTDGTRGRVYKGDGTTRLAADWIDFDDTAETGLLRVLWSGTLATTGTQQLWIEPPVSGNAAVLASDTYGSDNAYDSSWEGYWPSGGGNDRTSNSSDGTANGSVTVGGASGKIGKATDFDGTDDYIDMGQPAAIDITGRNMFVAAWIEPDTVSGNLPVVGIADTQYMLRLSGDVPTFFIYDSGWNQANGTGTASANAWHWLSGGVDSSGVVRVQLDNAGEGALSTNRDIDASIYDFNIGRNSEVTSRIFDGAIQHVQVHSLYRSTDWRSSEYDQTNDQSTFWGTWSWETSGGGTPQELAGTLSAIPALSGAIEISRTLSGTLAGQATASAALQVSRALAGQATAQSGITAALQITRTLSGALAGQSSAVGAVEVARTLAGVLAATSELSGDLSTVKLIDLAGTLSGSSTASGDVLIERALSGTLSGTAEATAAIQVIRELAGVLVGQAAASGNLQVGALVVYNEIVELAVQWAGDVAILVTWSGDTEIPVTWRET